MNIIYNKNKPLYTQKKKGASTWITKTIKITSLTPKCKVFGNILFLTFRNQNSAASYRSDTIEFLEFTEKSFLETTASDVENYYAIQQKKINEKELQPSTVAKKIRELNSLSTYIEENKEYYHIKDNYQNHFAAYLPHIEKMK